MYVRWCFLCLPADRITSVKFGVDAKYLAVGTMDRNLRVFGLPVSGAEEPWIHYIYACVPSAQFSYFLSCRLLPRVGLGRWWCWTEDSGFLFRWVAVSFFLFLIFLLFNFCNSVSLGSPHWDLQEKSTCMSIFLLYCHVKSRTIVSWYLLFSNLGSLTWTTECVISVYGIPLLIWTLAKRRL